jgi:hypothetical protein
MHLHIISANGGHLTAYAPAELLKLARSACKGKGKLTGHWITVRVGYEPTLTVQYQQKDGWSTTTNVAI